MGNLQADIRKESLNALYDQYDKAMLWLARVHEKYAKTDEEYNIAASWYKMAIHYGKKQWVEDEQVEESYETLKRRGYTGIDFKKRWINNSGSTEYPITCCSSPVILKMIMMQDLHEYMLQRKVYDDTKQLLFSEVFLNEFISGKYYINKIKKPIYIPNWEKWENELSEIDILEILDFFRLNCYGNDYISMNRGKKDIKITVNQKLYSVIDIFVDLGNLKKAVICLPETLLTTSPVINVAVNQNGNWTLLCNSQEELINELLPYMATYTKLDPYPWEIASLLFETSLVNHTMDSTLAMMADVFAEQFGIELSTIRRNQKPELGAWMEMAICTRNKRWYRPLLITDDLKGFESDKKYNTIRISPYGAEESFGGFLNKERTPFNHLKVIDLVQIDSLVEMGEDEYEDKLKERRYLVLGCEKDKREKVISGPKVYLIHAFPGRYDRDKKIFTGSSCAVEEISLGDKRLLPFGVLCRFGLKLAVANIIGMLA